MIDFNKPLIKFTFNLNNIFKKEKNNFNDTLRMCKVDYNRLIVQNDVFNILNYLDPKKYKGFCTLVSIYNAFPDIFKNINELCDFIKEQLSLRHKYGSLGKMREEINKKFHKDLLFDETNLNESYLIFKNNIQENKPVVISYDFQSNNMLIPVFGQHTVTLFGYDNNFIYYKENSDEDYLFTSLALYLYAHFRLYGVTKDNPEYERLIELLKHNTNQEVYEYSKGILGYNIGRNDIRTLKKEFLVNETYFNDINRLITYNGKIEKYFSEDDCSNQIKINFSELIKRLNSINK